MVAGARRARRLVGILALLGVAGCGGDARDGDGATSPVARPPGAPPVPQLAAVRDRQVLLLKGDGTQLRVLAAIPPSSAPPLAEATVSGDEADVVYSALESAPASSADIGTPRVAVVSREGGEKGGLVGGYLATVSHDGQHLAYVRRDPYSVRLQVVLRRLASGEERVLNPAPPAQSSPFVVALSWSGDARRVAVSIARGPNRTDHSTVIVDASTSLYYDRGIEVTASPGSHDWVGRATFMRDGNLFAVKACCRASPGGEYQSASLVVVDPASKAVLRTVAQAAPNTPVSELSVSADGHFFAWIAASSLHISEDGGPPAVLGDRYVAASILP